MNFKDKRHISATLTDAGTRLDVFLASKLAPLSRAQLNKMIKAGHVKADAQSLKPSSLIVGNENFTVLIPQDEPSTLTPENIPLEILLSDAHIAVINKPSGLVVHPGAGVFSGTLCHALLHHFPEMNIGCETRPGIVHRLDKETSGIMIIAKTSEAHQILSDDFKHRRVKKIYRAICFGEVRENQFELKTGHARHPFNRLKYFTKLSAPKIPSTNVRLAHTSFHTLARRYGMTELKVTLHTGRTHQIRAHLSDIDHPLLGDELYGGKRALPKNVPSVLVDKINNLSGQVLHAETLEFFHPITKEYMSLTAPMPDHLKVISEFLK